MKPIQNQYQDLLEGKMSKSNFLTNVKRTLSDYVSNVTSFDDAVKILKNKRILSEIKEDTDQQDAKAEEMMDFLYENPKFDFHKAAIESASGDKVEKREEDEEGEPLYFSLTNDYVNYYIGSGNEIIKYNAETGERYSIGNLKDYDDHTKEAGYTDEYDEFQQDRERHLPEGKKLNEDWGSSDQATFNKAIHKDLGMPKDMPMPFDSRFESAVEDAVDFWWDEWDEYVSDREGLIDHAKKLYYRAYFPEKFKAFQEMFSEGDDKEEEEYKEFQQDRERHLPESKVNEALSTDAYIRMDGLVPQKSLSDLVKGSRGIIKALKDEGFDEEDIFDFIVDSVKTLDDEPRDQEMIKRYEDEQDAKHTLPGGHLREDVNIDPKTSAELDRVNPLEYNTGLDYELDLSNDFSAEGLQKAIKKVLKNLAKDQIYYTNLKASLTTKINKKQIEAAKQVEVKKDNQVDDLNKLKTLVKNHLANTKTTLGKKEKASSATPKGVKLMKEEEEKFDAKQHQKGELKKFSDKMIKQVQGGPATKKNTLKDKIKEYVSKQLKKEAIKFTIGQTGQEHEYKNPKDAPEFEKDLKAAGVKFTKTSV